MTREVRRNTTVPPLHRRSPRIREIALRNFRGVQVLDLPGVWGGKPHALFFHPFRRRIQPLKDERGTSESRRKQRGCGGKAIPPRTLKQSYNARGWESANRPGRLGRLGRLGQLGHRAQHDLAREVREKHHRSNATFPDSEDVFQNHFPAICRHDGLLLI